MCHGWLASSHCTCDDVAAFSPNTGLMSYMKLWISFDFHTNSLHKCFLTLFSHFTAPTSFICQQATAAGHEVRHRQMFSVLGAERSSKVEQVQHHEQRTLRVPWPQQRPSLRSHYVHTVLLGRSATQRWLFAPSHSDKIQQIHQQISQYLFPTETDVVWSMVLKLFTAASCSLASISHPFGSAEAGAELGT